MLTQDFYDDCWRTVLQGINQGLIICPPLEKPKDSKNTYRKTQNCSVCGKETEMHSVWQKMCQPCSIAKDHQYNRRKRR
jgi:hypothetical protein